MINTGNLTASIIQTLRIRAKHFRDKSLKEEIIQAVKEKNIEKILVAMAASEESRKTAPHSAGVYLEKLLSTDNGAAKLGEAAEIAAITYPESVILVYFRVLALALNERFDEAHVLLSTAIISSRDPQIRKKYSELIARKRTIALIKIWRVLDIFARENMQWLEGSGDAYADFAFMNSYDPYEDSVFDSQLALFYAEPLLQGKHLEKYLTACREVFSRADKVNDKLKVVSAIYRQGIRRLPVYHEAYALARECLATLRPIWENGRKTPGDVPLPLVRTLRLALIRADVLDMHSDVNLIKKTILSATAGPGGKKALWVAALALMEVGPDVHLDDSKQMISLAGKPKSIQDICDYLNWACLAQEYHAAYAFFHKQPNKMLFSRAGLIYVKILQRMGEFREAERISRGVQAAILARPHTICPYSSWTNRKRTGELRFLADTADIYTMIPQPKEPKGVIFVTPRSIEQTRKTPLAVLIELKRTGWAIIPLVEGLLPYEETGIKKLDILSGCLTMDRRMSLKARGHLDDTLQGFNFVAEKGELNWKGLDLSHALWEEGTINRRMYNIDYSCPALQKYLGNAALWTKMCAVILQNTKPILAQMNLRAGFLIQFNFRLPDSIFRYYCEKYGDTNSFFCLHSANGYQNYFSNFSTNISTKGIMRNMTRHPETRSGSFPVPAEFEAYYQENKHRSDHMLNMVKEVTSVKRSTEGQKEMPADAKLALAQIMEWKANGGKVACAFGKVVCDSGVPYDGGPVHKNMKQWINDTIACARKSNTMLLIKPHPHELKEPIACFINEHFKDLIEEPLATNIMMVGHRWFDIAMLRDFLDLGLIYNGTTSVELGILGIPTVVCSHFAPVDYPINHTVPRNHRHYKRMVRFEDPVVVDPELQQRAACWLYYMSSNKITLDYRYHSRPITNKVVYPPWWFRKDVNAYFAQGDHNVEELARRAVE